MTPRIWFLLMLCLPLLIPVALGLVGHLAYNILPGYEFKYELTDTQVHIERKTPTSSSGYTGPRSYGVQGVVGYLVHGNNFFGWISMLLNIAAVTAASGYCLFLACLTSCIWKLPPQKLWNLTFALPILFIPFFYAGLWIDDSDILKKSKTALGMIPFLLAFGYGYVALARYLTPKRFRS